jgi:hypothetical protein
MWRKLSDGGALVSVDEARRMVVTEGRSVEFGGDEPTSTERVRQGVMFNAAASSG